MVPETSQHHLRSARVSLSLALSLFLSRGAVALLAGQDTQEWIPRPPLLPPLHCLSSPPPLLLLRAQPSCFSSSTLRARTAPPRRAAPRRPDVTADE